MISRLVTPRASRLAPRASRLAPRAVLLPAILAVSLILSSGCTDEPGGSSPAEPGRTIVPTERGGRRGPIDAFPTLTRDIPAVALDPRDREATQELSDAELVTAVRTANGIVMVGLKPATVARTVESGVFPAISRAQIAAARELLVERGARIVRTMRRSSITVLEIEPEDAPMLRALPVVNYLQPSGMASVGMLQQDTSWGVKKIGADWAWANPGALGQYVNVTLIDSGVDSLHLSNYGLDGPADLTWDCLYVPTMGQSNTCYVRGAQESHGEFMASVINARDNSSGEIGVAPSLSNFASVKVCHYYFSSSQFGCPTGDVVAAIDWATDEELPRHVVNLSLQYCDSDDPILEALTRASAAGLLLVSIAGNVEDECSGNATGVVYPGKHSMVLTTSGTLSDDSFAGSGACDGDGSRSGSEVDISAPYGARGMIYGGDWDDGCGTSISGAFVTGAAALIWSQHLTESAAQIRTRLLSSAQVLGGGSQPQKFGAGRVSVYNALYVPPPPPLTASISGASIAPPSTSCNWFAGAGNGTPPYSWEWYIDWTLQGSTSDQLNLTTPGSGFTIQLKVTDANSDIAWAYLSVDIDSQATCYDQ